MIMIRGELMKKGTAQVLSFVSGLTIAAVVIGITLSRSPRLRGEIENQVNGVLNTTRSVVDAYKSVASKSKAVANLITNDPIQKTASEEAAASKQTEQINNDWDFVEDRSS